MLLVIIKIIVKIIKMMITVTTGIWSERLPDDASWRVCPNGGGQGGDHQDIGQPHSVVQTLISSKPKPPFLGLCVQRRSCVGADPSCTRLVAVSKDHPRSSFFKPPSLLTIVIQVGRSPSQRSSSMSSWTRRLRFPT